MQTTSKIFISLLFCLALSLASGYGSEGEATVQANIAEQERKAGERMVLTIKDVEYAFRWCPAGTFMMGSPVSEEGRYDNETQHRVTLSHGFWMLKTEVTQKMWKGVMKNNPSSFKGDKLPVEQVSWNDCQEYIKKLNELLAGTPGAPTGFKFSLPMEAQWEYACRAGTTTAYHFGNTLNKEQANFGGGPGAQTKEVGSYPPNAWGLYDMHGNVREWCSDNYAQHPRGVVIDPVGSLENPLRGLRGGSYLHQAAQCRSAWREQSGKAAPGFGLRLALVSEE